MALEIDNSIFLSDFGQDAVFTLQSGNQITVQAIFDNSFYNAQIGEIDLETTLPRLTCVESDILEVKDKDTVLVNGKNYKVLRIQPDGTGMAVVVLAK